jgi:hypothetical protein
MEKKFANYFLGVAVLNSYVIYEIASMRDLLDRKKYITAIIESLLAFGNQNIEKLILGLILKRILIVALLTVKLHKLYSKNLQFFF